MACSAVLADQSAHERCQQSAHEVYKQGRDGRSSLGAGNAGGATVGAAFMEIRTDAGVTDRLISAASPAAGRVEVHTHIMDGDVMKMRRVDALELKAGAVAHPQADGRPRDVV